MWWINLIIVLLAIPVGYLISYMADDELKIGKRYFRVIIIVGIILGILFWLLEYAEVGLAMFFIAIVALVSLLRAK